MLSHQDIWAALDKLAGRFAMSPSAMARQAGLDPTTFNKSKRSGTDGKERWPSSESLAKVLNALGVSFEDFAALTAKSQAGRLSIAMGANVPLLRLSQAREDGFFDNEGRPAGEGWDEIRMPGVSDDDIFALQIAGDAMLPILRDGDRAIVSPNANIRRGDRVIIKTRSGEVMAKSFDKMNTDSAELLSLNAAIPSRALPLKDIQWMARIVWISQ
jgi:phage repressor protein C with HTH and peptisase S24 domain